MFIWIGAGEIGAIPMTGGAGVRYSRGSSSSIGWFWTGITAMPWIMASRSPGAGEACAVWRTVGISDGVSSSDRGSGLFLQR